MAIQIPERNHLSFPELIERWGCSENDVRSFIISGELVPSYVANRSANVVRFEQSEERGQPYWTHVEVENDVVHESEEDRKEFPYKWVYADGFYFLVHPWQTAPFNCHFFYLSKDRNHKQDSGETCLLVTSSGEKGRLITLDEVMKNGAVMMSEVARLEAASAAELDNPIHKRKETAYLNIIGALLSMMLEAGPNGETRSGFKDEAAIKDGILHRFPKKSGLSQRNLHEKFPDARRSLNTE